MKLMKLVDIFTYFLVVDIFKYIIGKFDYKIMSVFIFPDI